ncbi:MAG: helix-turn-helix domain-containing protein [Myxococcales bacterium]|nr:helix-turn-helix domain-containing protein [Myxococcales bacterium]
MPRRWFLTCISKETAPMPTATEIAARLMRAREAARISVETAASAAELPPDLVREVERGQGLTAGRVAALANVYGYSEEDLLDDAPLETAVSVLLRGDPHADDLALHLGRLTAVCREYTQLEDLLGSPAQGRIVGFPPAGPPAPPPWRHGEELATLTRSKLDLGIAPIRSMSALLEQLGVRLVWTDRLPEELQGLSLHDPLVGPSIVANTNGRVHQWWTLRTTIAHELCHILYDRVPTAPLGIASRRNQRDDLEQRANAFSVYFLAPREGVRALLMSRGCLPFQLHRSDVHAVMMHFGLGKEAATAHLLHLDWISRPQREGLLGLSYPTEPEDDSESPESQPDLARYLELGVPLERISLVRVAERAHERGVITTARFREALGLSPFADLRSVLAG